ncbi:MAG: hypothetical protein V1704_03825 [Candidatus Vogelbacteria bacterium]
MKKHLVIVFVLAIVFSFLANVQNNTFRLDQPQSQVANLQATLLTDIPNQILRGQANYEIEYKIPSYLPEYLKHPQKIFSGRDIKVVKENGESLKENEITNAKLSKRDRETKVLTFSKIVDIKLSKNKEPFITLPLDAETGYYTLDFQSGGEQYLVPIEINGLTENEKNQIGNVEVGQVAFSLDTSILSIKRLDCHNCYWESVSGINPNNENYGYLFGSNWANMDDYSGFVGILIQTKDAWLTSQIFNINALTNPLLKEYGGDPKLAFTKDGKLTLSSMFFSRNDQVVTVTGGIYQDSASGNFPAQLRQIVLQDIPNNLPPEIGLLFDYGKMAIDTKQSSPYFNSIYIFTNILWFDEPDNYGEHRASGFLTMRDGVIIKKRLEEVGLGINSPQSALVADGIIYTGRGYGHIGISSSSNGGQNFIESLLYPPAQDIWCNARLIYPSDGRSWMIYPGPELAVDKQGRLYVAFSRPKECVRDPSHEFPDYANDFDVLVSYSDDHAVTWSQPVKVNDDNSGGDQGFANIKVDDNGVVYVAFLDHRENQDQAQYDVYLTQSNDRGQSFSSNIKINDTSVPNFYGGRNPGDYLDMLAVGQTKIFVSHPCVNLNYPQDGRPSDACVTTLSKSIADLPDTTPPSVPTNLTLTPVSTSQINLHWSPSTDPIVSGQTTSGLLGYQIYRDNIQIAKVTNSVTYQDTGLTANTTYQYAVASYDAVGNPSVRSPVVSATTFPTPIIPPPDLTPPSTITDFKLTSLYTQGRAGLNWRAPYQDSNNPNSGAASSYDIRYSLNPITETSWNSSAGSQTFQVIDEPTPRDPNTVEIYILSGLLPSYTYYVAIKSQDAVGNISALSNNVIIRIPPTPVGGGVPRVKGSSPLMEIAPIPEPQ